MGAGRIPLFKGTVASGATAYVGIPIRDGVLGAHVGWKDATSSATITVELSSFAATDAPVSEAGSAWEWKDSGETFTGPAASAAGAFLINLENVRQLRGRIKIVAAADCDLEIHNGAAG